MFSRNCRFFCICRAINFLLPLSAFRCHHKWARHDQSTKSEVQWWIIIRNVSQWYKIYLCNLLIISCIMLLKSRESHRWRWGNKKKRRRRSSGRWCWKIGRQTLTLFSIRRPFISTAGKATTFRVRSPSMGSPQKPHHVSCLQLN